MLKFNERRDSFQLTNGHAKAITYLGPATAQRNEQWQTIPMLYPLPL